MTELAWPSLRAGHMAPAAPSPEATLSAVMDAMPVAYMVLDTDRRIVRCGGGKASQLGLLPAAAIGEPVDTLFAEVTGLHECVTEALSGAIQSSTATVNGKQFSMQYLPPPADDNFVTVIATEVPEPALKPQDSLWENSQERYALAVLGANDGLWDWNLEDGTIYLSARWRSLLGLENQELKDSPEEWLGRIHPDDLVAFCEDFDSHIEGKSNQFEHEYRIRHVNGEFRWMKVRGLVVRQDDGKAYRMAGSQSDITDRKLAEERLMHGALHDPLTGLPNRALMLDRIGQTLARTERDDDLRFALAILDLDRFMVVNESLGHGVGDELLVALSRRLEPELGFGDTLARLGGDEFAILIDAYGDFEEVKDFVQRLQLAIAKPFTLNGKDVFTSASFGIVVGGPHYTRANDMLRDADLAMYRAKKEGKAGFEVFEEKRHRPRFDQLQVETSLRHALDEGWIHAFYQPIVDLQSGEIKGFEALSRLIHPNHGVVPPAEFIGIAEETGLIVPLGEQILRMACEATVGWQREFGLGEDFTISVNFSARHLADESIVELLSDVLAETGLPPRSLKIEITETLIMSNPELAAQTLDRIKKLGIILSLDDFGTGYSSLGYLRRFPIDTLKMDRSFVGRMDTDRRDLELVRMIIQLAHTLGMDVVGEGIETKSQFDRLGALTCEYGQGYFFAKPLPAEEAVMLLSAPPRWC